jgi:NitT/TauT family transport system permease protein
MKKILDLFTPNKAIDKNSISIMLMGQIVVVFLLWNYSTSPLIPKPLDILSAWKTLALNGGLIQDLYISTKLCFHAILISVVVSAILAYLTILPFFKPAGFVMEKMRFLPMVGLSFVFTLMSANGYDLKIKLLVFGMSVFILNSMIGVVKSVTDNEYNHARTIFGNEWKVVWERVILGKAHQMMNAVKQNFAIAWTMLTFAEGLVRSDGGVGALMLNENKHLQLDSVFAIQMSLFFLGILIDYLFGVIRNMCFPYADLATQKR